MARDLAPLPRRRLLQLSGCAGALLAAGQGPDAEAQAPPADELPDAIRALRPMTEGVSPVTVDEHRARLARAQGLLAEAGLDAMVLGPGSSLAYFTGAEWGLSERFLGVVLGRSGDPVWVAPAFEKDRALEQVRGLGDVRVWAEDEAPFSLVAGALADRGAATGRVGIDEALPFAFSDGIGQAVPPARLSSATPVTAAGRRVKDAHELALMRRACAITLHAFRSVFASLREGLTAAQVSGWVAAAHRRLGVRGGALVLFGPDAAFPHGTARPKALARGDVVLIDGGCRVHGYQSDITRTGVFGKAPTDRQRQIWDLVRKAQAAAFAAARPGVECQAVDAAARRVIEDGGFGPGYLYFTHRLGHGIGLDGHEWPYMVRGDRTRLAAGMTFTDEPGIYVRGELGIRHEDTVVVTPDGCENLGPKWSGTPEEPAVV
jgi:Xaa-Pro dipeptidase